MPWPPSTSPSPPEEIASLEAPYVPHEVTGIIPPNLPPHANRLAETFMTTSRALPVTGGHNLRDLGGYVTADGRTLKWRTLYRSGAIYSLTADDRAYMRQLGITAICDLRTTA